MSPDPALSGESRTAPPSMIEAPINGKGRINYWISQAIYMYVLSSLVCPAWCQGLREVRATLSHHPVLKGLRLVRKLELTLKK